MGGSWVIDSYKIPTFISYCTCGGPHYKLPTFHISMGDHSIPYKVWGTISHWQLQGSNIPYKVWGDHKSLTVTSFPHCTCEGTLLQSSCILHVGGPHYKVLAFQIRYGSHWQLQGSHIPYKVSWDHKSLTVTIFLYGNHIVHVGGPHYKVHASYMWETHYKVPEFHIRYWGIISHWQLHNSCIQMISYM